MKYSIFLLLLISSTIRAQFGDPIYVGLYHQFDNRLKQEIHIQDINEDGYLDIVMPGSNFSYYLNNGDSTFILEAINFESPNNLELGTPRMDFADFNNDGEMDILLDRTDYIPNASILLLKNNGIDLSNFPKGTYLFKISDNQNASSQLFIKM
jgi:hypothetical protein